MGSRMTADDLQVQVARAQSGDQVALEQVVRAIQDQIDHLAVRMLFHLEDARDATQDILILVVTKLSTFRGDASFGRGSTASRSTICWTRSGGEAPN